MRTAVRRGRARVGDDECGGEGSPPARRPAVAAHRARCRARRRRSARAARGGSRGLRIAGVVGVLLPWWRSASASCADVRCRSRPPEATAVEAPARSARRRSCRARATSSPATATSRSACASPAGSSASSSTRGGRVRKGDPLVQLDDRDYRAALAGTGRGSPSCARTRAHAEADLRAGQRCAENFISQSELDVAREHCCRVARHDRASSRPSSTQAKVNLDYTTLRAPTDGVILAKLKEVGEIAVPGGFAGSGDLDPHGQPDRPARRGRRQRGRPRPRRLGQRRR